MATKVKVLLHRIESKDYLDIHALLQAGGSLAEGIAAARALYGRTIAPAEVLKTLTYFKGGDLSLLPQSVQNDLVYAVKHIEELPPLPRLMPHLQEAL